MGLFSRTDSYRQQVTEHRTNWQTTYGWACECGKSANPFTSRWSRANDALMRHSKNEHGY